MAQIKEQMEKPPCFDLEISNWSDTCFNLVCLAYVTDANLFSRPEISSMHSKEAYSSDFVQL